MTSRVTVVDSLKDLGEEDVVVWRGRTADRTGLLDQCEDPAQEIRTQVIQICRWLDDLLIECSGNDDGAVVLASQSLMTERNFLKTSFATDLACVVALKQEIHRRQATEILYKGNSRIVSAILAALCTDLGLEFKTSAKKARSKLSTNRLKSFLWLSNWMLKRVPFFSRGQNRQVPPTDFALFSYFAPEDAVGPNAWKSRYWGGLPDSLIARGREITVINMFVSTRGSSARRALQATRAWSIARPQQRMLWLESWFSVSVFWQTVSEWNRQRVFWKGKIPLLEEKVHSSHNSWIWPVIAGDVGRSLMGDVALGNCLWGALFDRLLSTGNRVDLGVYLRENQPWERALTLNWRQKRHGRLIGFAHSTVREWDLRYVQSRALESNRLLAPDITAATGPLARARLSDGLQSTVCAEVEATRSAEKAGGEPVVGSWLLVAGSFDWNRTTEVVEALCKVPREVAWWDGIIIRFHPVTKQLDYEPPQGASLTSGSLGEALSQSEVVIAVGDTSVALDAYLFGRPTVVVLPNDDLDRSPAPMTPEVTRVATVAELIMTVLSRKFFPHVPNPSFKPTLNDEFPKWWELISGADDRGPASLGRD